MPLTIHLVTQGHESEVDKLRWSPHHPVGQHGFGPRSAQPRRYARNVAFQGQQTNMEPKIRAIKIKNKRLEFMASLRMVQLYPDSFFSLPGHEARYEERSKE